MAFIIISSNKYFSNDKKSDFIFWCHKNVTYGDQKSINMAMIISMELKFSLNRMYNLCEYRNMILVFNELCRTAEKMIVVHDKIVIGEDG